MHTDLLKDDLSSFYWAGFLMADGSSSKPSSIRLHISIKDIDHLRGYQLIVGGNIKLCNSTNSCYIDIRDKTFVDEFKTKFGWNNRKTYNPPDILIFENFSTDQQLAWLIGYIDGDGHIKNQFHRSDFCISIQAHSSWIAVFEYFNSLLSAISNTSLSEPKILNSGYVRYNICNINIIKLLKRFVTDNNLPVLQRKWNIIDENYRTRSDKKQSLIKTILDLKNQKMTNKEISEKLKIPYNTICYHLYNKEKT